MDEQVHLFQIFWRNIIRGFEILDGTTDSDRKIRGIKMGDPVDTADTIFNIIPGIGDIISNRGECPHSCHNYAFPGQNSLL